MRRRECITAGGAMLGTAVTGCLGAEGTRKETIVDDAFREPYQTTVDVDAGDTIRMEIEPLEPRYQLYSILAKDSRANGEDDGLKALTLLNEVREERAREVTSEAGGEYFIAVAWFDDEDRLETDQFHLRVTVG